MKQNRLLILISLFLIVILTGCPLDSPMKMEFHIISEPIVGKEVTAIIKRRSNEAAPHTKLEIDASDDIHFSNSKLKFDIPLPEDEWVEVRVPFTVRKKGIHTIAAYAFNSYDPRSDSGFGAGKTLYIRSGISEAAISEDELSE